MEKIVRDSLRKSPASESPLLAWPLACGSAVAERTRAIEFSRGVLRVEVPDAAWRGELQHLAPRYVYALNRYAKGVTRVEFVVKRKVAQTA
jgi:Dna[CI] antecedent DciA-like protein